MSRQTDKLHEAVSKLDPSDGFHVSSFTTTTTYPDDTLVLYLGFRLNGQPFDLPGAAEDETLICLRRWVDPDENDKGDCMRDELLLQAVCRYLNTGGTINRLQSVLALAGMSIKDIDFDFGGRRLAMTRFDDGDYCHLFTKPTSHLAVEWWENNHIEVVDLEREVVDGERLGRPADSGPEV